MGRKLNCSAFTLARMTHTGMQDCQLFAPPLTFLIKEHFVKSRKISKDHTDYAKSSKDQGMATAPGLPEFKESLDNTLRHSV